MRKEAQARRRSLTGSRRAALGGLACACLTACFGTGLAGALAPALGQAPPKILRAETAPVSGATVTLSVELDRPGPVTVEYGPEGEGRPRYRLTDTAWVAKHVLILVRLPADTPHEYAVTSGGDTVRGSFRSAPLPPRLRDLITGSVGRTTAPLILLELGERPGFRGLVALDGDGSVVWYCQTGGTPHGAIRLSRRGTWVVGDPTYGLREINAACETVSGRRRTPGVVIHHDLVEAADGSVLYLTREERQVGEASMAGEFIRRWNPETGADEEVWSSFEQLDPATDRSPRSQPDNWLHANSLAWGPGGNLVIGLAHLDQVVSLRPDLSGSEWRLGGPNATHPILEGRPFSGQHTAAEIAPGRVLLFDNGLQRAEPWSRAVEYRLDEDGAREIWSFRPAVDNWSRVMGSARRLTNGNTLVDFGASERQNGSSGPIEIYEVDPDGVVVWHAVFATRFEMIYRATPVEGIGGEEPVEAAETRESGTTVFLRPPPDL